jgi:hypothetical protein
MMFKRRRFESVLDFMTKRMPHLLELYTYTESGAIATLNLDFTWNGYSAFELDVFACDIAKYEADGGALMFAM